MEHYITAIIYDDWKDLVYRHVRPMYEINWFGVVRNKQTKKVIAQNISEKGYVQVGLMSTLGKQMTYKLARIVAYNFLTLPDFNDGNFWTVNHKEGNKRDNSAGSLEWVTLSDNIQHAFNSGLNKPLRGSTNGSSKYSEGVIHMICSLLEKNKSSREIKAKVSSSFPDITINRHLVWDLRHRRCWNHITALYSYP